MISYINACGVRRRTIHFELPIVSRHKILTRAACSQIYISAEMDCRNSVAALFILIAYILSNTASVPLEPTPPGKNVAFD